MDVWCGMYRLVEGVSVEDYVAWNDAAAEEVKKLMPGIGKNWQMYWIEDTTGSGDGPSWTIVETIELVDWRDWMPAWQSHPRLVEIWNEFEDWIDFDTLTVLSGKKIYGTDF